MAYQRQEGHSFMKRSLNMPVPCRGACSWMMAAWCESVCVCVNDSGWDGWFCRLPVWAWNPRSHCVQYVPVFFIYFLQSSYRHPFFTGLGDDSINGFSHDLVALKSTIFWSLLHHNQESQALIWDSEYRIGLPILSLHVDIQWKLLSLKRNTNHHIPHLVILTHFKEREQWMNN